MYKYIYKVDVDVGIIMYVYIYIVDVDGKTKLPSAVGSFVGFNQQLFSFRKKLLIKIYVCI